MSSRLNPRDYDLGELRDAVRETSRQEDGRRGARREDGRRDAQHDDRTDGSSNGAGPEAVRSSNGDSPVEGQLRSGGSPKRNGSTNGTSSDDAPSPSADAEAGDEGSAGRAGEGRHREDERTGSHSWSGPSSDSRADTAREADDRPAVGRMRRNRRRFARSASRDRTADGAPRRRGDAGAEEGTGWRPSGRAGPSEYARRSDRSGAAAPDQRPTGPRTGGFELLSGASRGDVERPYLDRLPQGYRAQVEIFAWLEELLAAGGRESTLAALEYYESVGWLSEASRESLAEFVQGLTAAEPPDPRPLDVDDHRNSLRYVARLAQRVDR